MSDKSFARAATGPVGRTGEVRAGVVFEGGFRPSLLRWFALFAAIASLAVVGATAQSAGAAITTCTGTGETFAGGAGISADPYLVSNQAQLEAIRTSTYVSCAFRQTTDIALTGAWTPIGAPQVFPVDRNFTGEYDGNGKTISGLNLTGDNLTYEGLFGYTKGPALITDLFVRGSVTSNTGGFGLGAIGMADSGTVVSNVHADVDVTATAGSIVGGLVGWGPEATIEESSASGDVIASSSVGGLIGQPYGRTFGAPPSRATITDSYATGNVTGSATGTGIGGLVGSLQGNDNRVIRSYATGQVTGGTSGGGTSGGLIGPQAGGTPYTGLTVTDSFWDTQTTGKSTSANGLGTGKTTAQMKSFSTFSAATWDITDGWSAATIWGICDGTTYPFLSGQYTSSPCGPPPPPPPPSSYVLSVTKSISDTGTGTVTSEPAGINCGNTCVKTYDPGTQVTLTANASPGSRFTGWTGACTNQQGPCTLNMTYTRVVTARFTAVDIHRLTVTKQGTGKGTVTSTPAGVDCGTTCDSQFSQFNDGEVVTLAASAAQGSTFTGWSGACTGTAPCQVTMDQARQVSATFTEDVPPPPLSDVRIELNTAKPATVPPSRAVQAVKVSCEGDAPCRIDSASAKAKAGGGSEQSAPVTFSAQPFPAGASQNIQVTIPKAVYDKLKKGKKSGLLTVNVRARGTEGPRDATVKVGLKR